MTDREVQSLIRMANDIAANFSFQADAVEQVANHLLRFWAPSMRQQIIAHLDEGGEGLTETAQQAVRRLSS